MNGNVPVKVGETYEVVIESIGGKGDGIAKVKGFVLFVPGVKKDDYVKIKVTKVLQNVGFAEVLGKLEGQAPVRERKYETFSQKDLQEKEEDNEPEYEDTEDFGNDDEEE